MAIQRLSVVIPRDDGGVEVFPLKQWLRQHPSGVPPGLDPSSDTSHRLRSGLRRLAWTMQETPTEVRLIKPSATSSQELADEALVPDESADENGNEPFFSLEYQLREFLATTHFSQFSFVLNRV
jgi:hypothetical protein